MKEDARADAEIHEQPSTQKVIGDTDVWVLQSQYNDEKWWISQRMGWLPCWWPMLCQAPDGKKEEKSVTRLEANGQGRTVLATRVDLRMDGLKWPGVEPYSFKDMITVINTGTASGNARTIVSIGARNARIIVTKVSSWDFQHGFSTQATSLWCSRLSYFTPDQLVLGDCPSCCRNSICYCIIDSWCVVWNVSSLVLLVAANVQLCWNQFLQWFIWRLDFLQRVPSILAKEFAGRMLVSASMERTETWQDLDIWDVTALVWCHWRCLVPLGPSADLECMAINAIYIYTIYISIAAANDVVH